MVDSDWLLLMRRIAGGACTPFLGAGACHGTLPGGSEVAARWADEHAYPLDDGHDLARVAQYIGVRQDDAMYPKELISAELAGVGPPDFDDEHEPHAVLARLPLSIYMTTNYDDFMAAALRHAGKQPRREICRWNASPAVREQPTHLDDGALPRAPRTRSSTTCTATSTSRSRSC